MLLSPGSSLTPSSSSWIASLVRLSFSSSEVALVARLSADCACSFNCVLMALRRLLAVSDKLRQALAVGQRLAQAPDHAEDGLQLRRLLRQRAAEHTQLRGCAFGVALNPAHALDAFFRLRIVGDDAQRAFVLAQGVVPVVRRHQAVAFVDHLARERQILNVEQRLLGVFPAENAVALGEVARFAVEALGFVVIARAHQRIGAVVGDARIKRDAVIRHDAANQVIFGFLAIFEGGRVAGLLAEDAIRLIDDLLVIARRSTPGSVRRARRPRRCCRRSIPDRACAAAAAGRGTSRVPGQDSPPKSDRCAVLAFCWSVDRCAFADGSSCVSTGGARRGGLRSTP